MVLVNDHTASASEIVAGALRDNCRAVLAGNRTYGKGLIQVGVDRGEGLCWAQLLPWLPACLDLPGCGDARCMFWHAGH